MMPGQKEKRQQSKSITTGGFERNLIF
jgi:hypothetical protein